MAKVFFKKGPSGSFTNQGLDSIIFKDSVSNQAPGFSEIYLGEERCGVGHTFGIDQDGLVPSPTIADIGKVLTPLGWVDPLGLESGRVNQTGLGSSSTRYPILLKGDTGVLDYTGDVHFLSTTIQNTPILSATADGVITSKGLNVLQGDIHLLAGNITMSSLDTDVKTLTLETSIQDSTGVSPSILLSRSGNGIGVLDQYTNWRIQNAASGVLTFTPERTTNAESPYVSIGTNVTATSFTVAGTSSADTYIKGNGGGVGTTFTGATDSTAGAAGLVPAPAIGDEEKVLKGDGTWGTVTSGVQSDWEEDDSSELSYVQNRPAVRAGTGTNAVVEGDIENVMAWGHYSHAEGGDETWTTIELSGDANEYSYTVDQSSANIVVGMILHYNGTYASVLDTYTFDDEVIVVLDNTLDENNALSNAEVGIVGGVSAGAYSHSEGFHTVSAAIGSHSEGYGTIAVNDGEHAEGKYNLPTRSNMVGGSITQHNTVHTIGIGIDEGARMNAVEVKYNGDMYLYGVGGYEGNNYNEAQTLQGVIADIQDFGSNMISTTYSELENLITNSHLIPGQQYRITDYVCTTTQANTQSAGNQFDIIVVADSENTLNENARAIQHTTSNQDYFYNCDLDSWELKYSFTGDTDRFAWADPDPASYTIGITLSGVVIGGGQNTTTATFVSNLGNGYWKWKRADNNNFLYSVANPEIDDVLYNSVPSPGMIAMSQGTINSITPTGNRGVIYYMKDEWGNEAPYDFKNIQFKRWAVTADQYHPSFVVDGENNQYGFYYGAKSLNGSNVLSGATYGNDFGWFYTFALKDLESGEWFDYTVVAHLGLKNDEGVEVACYDNHIEPATDESSSGKGEMAKMLNNIVFFNCFTDLSDTSYADDYSYCNNNRFLGNCHSNTFGNYCNNNSLGNGFQNNSFGNYFQYNSFGNNCRQNSFGNDCNYNSFGNNCRQNSFGNECYQNSFGNGFQNNSFGNSCYRNSFGNYCTHNSFGNNCYSNTFGNNFYSNTFGNNCYSNSFGNSCSGNTFGNYCICNSFGNGCLFIRFSNSSGTTRNFYKYITVENGNQYINLDCTGTLSDSSVFRNVKIAQGVNNTSTYKTIQDSRTNQTFQTVYQPKDSEVISVA